MDREKRSDLIVLLILLEKIVSRRILLIIIVISIEILLIIDEWRRKVLSWRIPDVWVKVFIVVVHP